MTAVVLLALGGLLALAVSSGVNPGAPLTALVVAWIAWCWFDEIRPK